MLLVRSLLVVLLFAVSLVQAQNEPQATSLTLKQAVEIALSPQGSARAQLAEESEHVVQAQSQQARAAVLPSFAGSIQEQNQTRNLAAIGIQLQIPGASIPTSVGPFSTFDARVNAEQMILDIGAIRRTQAAHMSVVSAKSTTKNTQDEVVSLVAQSYLSAARAAALLETAKANVTLAEALVKVAEDRLSVGKGIELEVTRSRSQLANENQRLLSAENEDFRARLQLCKDIGLPMDSHIQVIDALAFIPVKTVAAEDAVKSALAARADLKATQQKTDQARLLRSAAAADRLPSVYGYADYGALGLTPDASVETHTIGVALKIPVFDGGRLEARREETASQVRQQEIQERELRAQIELEVRESQESLRVAAAQVEVSQQGVRLAEDELAQARRRYEAGLTTSLDVIEAQTRLERARDNSVAALYAHNIARIAAARSMGIIMSIIP